MRPFYMNETTPGPTATLPHGQALIVWRQNDEPWRDCAARIGRVHGREQAVLDIYGWSTADGWPEDEACMFALWQAGCLGLDS